MAQPRPANNPTYRNSVFPLAVDDITNPDKEIADAVMATQQSLIGGGAAGTALTNLTTTSVTATSVKLGTATLWGGSGAPATGLGVVGDYYFRTDTPSTALQRIYIKTAAATWTGIV